MVYMNYQNNMGEFTDFDLVLVDPTGQIVEYSANEQKRDTDSKSEYVFHVPEIPGLYAIGISNAEKEIDPTNVHQNTLQ